MPRTNQLWRCSDEPCVQDSGWTLTLRALLDAVVSDRSCCVERLGDVLSRQILDESRLERLAYPEPRVAIGLELDADLAALRARVTIRAPKHAGQVLHMVAVLVGQDVCLRERSALRPELGLELVEEAEVDVDVTVVRAVERPDRGRRAAAPGLDRPVEESGRRRLVTTQCLRPVRLDAVDAGEDPAVLALVRVRPV